MRPADHVWRPLAVAALLVLVAACGSDPDDAAPEPMTTTAQEAAPTATAPATAAESEDPEEGVSAEVLIEITDFSYVVPDVVPPGTQVAVTNSDSVGHTVTSDDGLFDVAVPPGDTVTFTAPDETGEYGFHCIPHPHMTATLVVG